jgi:hypothetical protein
MFRYVGQAGGGPLMSNVRPHRNYLALNAAFGGAGFKTLVRSAAFDRDDFKWVEAQHHRGTDTTSVATAGAPRTDLGFFGLRPRSLFSASRLVGLAQAARPLAGGSQMFGRDQAAQTGSSVAALRNYGRVWYEIEHRSSLGASSGSPQRQRNHRASIQRAA